MCNMPMARKEIALSKICGVIFVAEPRVWNIPKYLYACSHDFDQMFAVVFDLAFGKDGVLVLQLSGDIFQTNVCIRISLKFSIWIVA